MPQRSPRPLLAVLREKSKYALCPAHLRFCSSKAQQPKRKAKAFSLFACSQIRVDAQNPLPLEAGERRLT
jgi:hypothetical protein